MDKVVCAICGLEADTPEDCLGCQQESGEMGGEVDSNQRESVFERIKEEAEDVIRDDGGERGR